MPYQIITDRGTVENEPTWERARRAAIWTANDWANNTVHIIRTDARKGRPDMWRIQGSEPVAVRIKGAKDEDLGRNVSFATAAS